MDKQAIREAVWDDLEDAGVARFPFPPHGRIPNYEGADRAAERLASTSPWREADRIKANPDAPQRPVRHRALTAGKTVFMAVPRLTDERCFLRLDPATIDDIDHATTIGGSEDVGVPVGPDEMEEIDLIVSGSVAVDDAGSRIGKGEGYSDLEYAILREFGLVDGETTTATTVHDRQVRPTTLPTTPLDVPMDIICTPNRTVRPEPRGKPTGIDWEALTADRRAEIPILDRIHESE